MSKYERTIVTTGASSGFGAAAVRAIADRGDHVRGTMRDTNGCNAAKKAELEGYLPRITLTYHLEDWTGAIAQLTAE